MKTEPEGCTIKKRIVESYRGRLAWDFSGGWDCWLVVLAGSTCRVGAGRVAGATVFGIRNWVRFPIFLVVYIYVNF